MGVAGSSRHLEDDVDQGSGLRDLPVDSGGGRGPRLVAEVDDEVADAPEEVVLVDFDTSCPGSAFSFCKHKRGIP